jgi:SWI/SNF-related matrix-associated actin-dependent regulator of chromatin subfamily A3
VATKLYPHQKKALTFLLEREQERTGKDGKFSSLWQERVDPMSRRTSWFHIVTQKEVPQKPEEAKGAILADDVRLHYLAWKSRDLNDVLHRWAWGKRYHV